MVLAACLARVVATTILHYEVLRLLSAALPGAPVAPRSKVVIVILAEFAAHCVQICLYGFALYALVRWAGAGSLGGGDSSLSQCLYFSAETFTSLGYGDVVPSGPLRLIAGAEALNGLLLIGWSASYAYIAMERIWNIADGAGGPHRR
jgi:hypothetical protein